MLAGTSRARKNQLATNFINQIRLKGLVSYTHPLIPRAWSVKDIQFPFVALVSLLTAQISVVSHLALNRNFCRMPPKQAKLRYVKDPQTTLRCDFGTTSNESSLLLF